MTMAIHGASPIIMSPVMYSGYSFKKRTAKRNIKNGPTIHVIKKETNNNFGLDKILGILENCTLVKGGYIIRMSPMASGIFVVP
jgi:hypothetical protein